MMRNCLHLVALVGLVLFLAACSSSTQPPAAEAPTQPAPTAIPPSQPPPSPIPTLPRPTSVVAPSPTITEMVKLDDITMYYASYGKGEPLLLLHGGMGSADTFARQVPAFAEKYQVITPDSRGQGRTTDADVPLSYHLMAEDMIRLMDYLKIDKAHILGWSDGGNIGLDMAINHPERVRSLLTYGANTSPDGMQPAFIDFVTNSTPERLAREAGGEYLRLSTTPEHLPVFVEKIKKMWLTEPNFTPAQLASITSPTAIVDGKLEQLVKLDHVEAIAKAIPNAELIWIPAATHEAPYTTPIPFNKVVLDFLKDK